MKRNHYHNHRLRMRLLTICRVTMVEKEVQHWMKSFLMNLDLNNNVQWTIMMKFHAILMNRTNVPTSSLIQWWKEKSSQYPRLSMLARKYLAVPATSGASESVFSKAGRTITDLRSNLCPETV